MKPISLTKLGISTENRQRGNICGKTSIAAFSVFVDLYALKEYNIYNMDQYRKFSEKL